MAGVDYFLCGWRVRSDLPLPELMPWTGDADKAPDILVEAGAVPERLETTIGEESWLSVGPDGRVLLQVPDVVRVLVRDGCLIRVDILQTDGKADWRLFVLGAAIGYLCHQRGAFPLHAASLTIGEKTVALLGESGAGKSTLAMALLRRGHGLLSDDLTVMSVGPAESLVLPAFPRLKLWRDSLEALGEKQDGLVRVREGLDKFDLQPREGFSTVPRRLDAILVLNSGRDIALSPVAAAAAVPVIIDHVVRRWVAHMLGRQAGLFAAAARIAATVPVMQLSRPFDFTRLDETARRVEEAVGE